jgi:hypothetical protein
MCINFRKYKCLKTRNLISIYKTIEKEGGRKSHLSERKNKILHKKLGKCFFYASAYANTPFRGQFR